MRKAKMSILKKIICFALFTYPYIFVRSQDSCPNCIPFMYVKNGESNKRLKSFIKVKKPLLDNIISQTSGQNGKTHPPSYDYPLPNVDNLIKLLSNTNPDGLFIYFGAYSAETTCNIPMTGILVNQIVLIFVPAKLIKDTYVPVPNNETNHYIFGSDNNPYPISSKCEPKWINNYITNIVNDSKYGLVGSIDKNALENHLDNTVNTPASDTRRILYTWDHFVQFIQVERNNQDNHHSSPPGTLYTDGIRIEFVAFSSSGVPGGDPNCTTPGIFKNRLHILFSFTHAGKIYKIKKYRRKPQQIQCSGKHVLMGGGGDNGQLCPYNCNP